MLRSPLTRSPFMGLTLLQFNGLRSDNLSVIDLSRRLQAPFFHNAPSKIPPVSSSHSVEPGSSITVYLVWGDAEISALGTVTAVDAQGNFIAFGHEFLKRGSVRYPCGGAYIHAVVSTAHFPVKLSSGNGIYGTVTSDTDGGIGGKLGIYAPSIPCELEFFNIDASAYNRYTFRTITDENLSGELISSVSRGLCEDVYGCNGGTLFFTLRIDGRNIPEGFTYKNIYYSDTDIITEAFKDINDILKAYFTQPYAEIMPCGISISAKVTSRPKILFIDDVTAPKTARPGGDIDIAVKLHEYRKPSFTRKFTLTVPSDTHGVMELIVRGGGIQPFRQSGIAGGWKSITSLDNMLTELNAMDANNELIIELNADRNSHLLNQITHGEKILNVPDLLPEENEYLSRTKERRKLEGTLKIFTGEYYIDGLMRRIIHTEGE